MFIFGIKMPLQNYLFCLTSKTCLIRIRIRIRSFLGNPDPGPEKMNRIRNTAFRKACSMQCCGSSPFFSDPDPQIRFSIYGSADPVFKIRIRIRVTPKRPDPTGSGSGSHLDMFLMFSKINIFYGIVYQIYTP